MSYRLSMEMEMELGEILNLIKEDQTNVEVLWAEPGIKYSIKTSNGYISAIRYEGIWSVSKQ